MVALEIAPFPEHLPRARVDAPRPEAAEVGVESPVLDERRRAGVGVERMAVLRIALAAELEIVDDPAGVAIDADGEEVDLPDRVGGRVALAKRLRVALHFIRRRDPHQLAEDDRGGVATAVDGRFPDDVFGFAPARDEVLGVRTAICGRTAKPRPVIARHNGGGTERNQRDDQATAHGENARRKSWVGRTQNTGGRGG